MSRIYDNWNRIVEATLRREKDRELCYAYSRSTSSSSISSHSHSHSHSQSPDLTFPSPLLPYGYGYGQQHLEPQPLPDPFSLGPAPAPEPFPDPHPPEKQLAGRRRPAAVSSCFNTNYTDTEDPCLKSLVPCSCVSERNLLAHTAHILQNNKISSIEKRTKASCRNIVAEGLTALGYNASICRSKWEKSTNFPAGEYEYVDVIIEGERMIIDTDFRSEFEIARATKAYKLLLQTLPNIFIGKAERLEKIIDIVSEAAKQSSKKKGIHLPPWRKTEYMKAKWLSPFIPTPTPTPNQIS